MKWNIEMLSEMLQTTSPLIPISTFFLDYIQRVQNADGEISHTGTYVQIGNIANQIHVYVDVIYSIYTHVLKQAAQATSCITQRSHHLTQQQ